MVYYVTNRGDYGVALANGEVPNNATIVKKYGRNPTVGTTFQPITVDSVYQTPQVTGITTLRIKAGGNVNDIAGGTGARELTLEGLDVLGNEITDTIALNGADASVSTTKQFLRLFRAYVSASGTYATSLVGSHAGNITIENSAGTADWGSISASPFVKSQTEIACYTVPRGKKAFVKSLDFSGDTVNKIIELNFTARENILETSAPYTAARVFLTSSNINNQLNKEFEIAYGPFPALTDIMLLAKIDSNTAEIHANFDIVVMDE
jgi:hypothetical protein